MRATYSMADMRGSGTPLDTPPKFDHRMRRKSYLAHLPAVVLIAALSLWFLQHTVGFGIDDSYITYRYAQNLLAGNGPVFNAGERYLGTTAPGFALLLAATRWLVTPIADMAPVLDWLDIAHLARYLSALALGGIALALYGFIARSFSGQLGRLAGAALAILLVTRAELAKTVGHETLTCIALILLGFYIWHAHRSLAALVFGLATLVRPDAGLAFVSAVAISLIFAPYPRWTAPLFIKFLASTAPFLVPVLMWALFAYVFYGSPIPGTILAKRAEAQLGYWPVSSLSVILEYVFGPPRRIRILFVILPLLGLCVATVRRDEVTGVGIWGILLLAFYAAIGTTFWYWYATPLIIIFSLYGVFALTWILEYAVSWKQSFGIALMTQDEDESSRTHYVAWVRPIPAKVLAYRFVIFPILSYGAIAFMLYQAAITPPYYNAHLSSFDDVIAYLHDKSPDGTSIATPEPGALAYYLGTQYRVIDALGLASPGVGEHIMRRDLDWAYKTYQPEWILVSYPNLGPQDSEWFAASYREAVTFTNAYWSDQWGDKGGLALHLFHRIRSN